MTTDKRSSAVSRFWRWLIGPVSCRDCGFEQGTGKYCASCAEHRAKKWVGQA